MADPARGRLLMPPPSGSPNRSQRSKSTIQAMSAASSSHSSVNTSTAFSESTKLRIREVDGDSCWACGSSPVQICHVIAQEDRQVPLWAELGLIDIPLHSFLNAIPLCPTCHNHFDCHIDAGFLFIPTDLDFFIEYELADKERRRVQAENGIVSKRRTPTAEDYKDHQVSKSIIAADAIGGQYLPVFLKSFLHPGRLDFDLVQALSKPREWHGAPLACIRRCIHALGSPRLGMKHRGYYDRLRRLYDLYFLDDEHLCQKLPNPAVQPQPIHDEEKHDEKKRSFDSIATSDPQPAKRHEGPPQRWNGRDDITFCPILQREVPAAWSLGPGISTEEAVRQFAPVIVRSRDYTHFEL